MSLTQASLGSQEVESAFLRSQGGLRRRARQVRKAVSQEGRHRRGTTLSATAWNSGEPHKIPSQLARLNRQGKTQRLEQSFHHHGLVPTAEFTSVKGAKLVFTAPPWDDAQQLYCVGLRLPEILPLLISEGYSLHVDI